jgi:hypothetical protein
MSLVVHEYEGCWDIVRDYPAPSKEAWQKGESLLCFSHVGASVNVAQYSFFGGGRSILCHYVLVMGLDCTYSRHVYCYPWYALLESKRCRPKTDYQIDNPQIVFL